MSQTFHIDWRCASTGMSDIVAERLGIRTRTRQGVWGDWHSECHDEASCPHHPSYRFLIDDSTGQIIGGTLYGPEAGEVIDKLKSVIAAELCDDELQEFDSSQALRTQHAK